MATPKREVQNLPIKVSIILQVLRLDLCKSSEMCKRAGGTESTLQSRKGRLAEHD